MFKILLVEDDAHLRTLLCKHLDLAGFNVIECSDGKEALHVFQNEKFDLLISDIMMPYINGNQLISEIRLLKNDFPIIILTALDTIADKKLSFEGGADDYLTKPINFDELIIRINALLRRYNIVNAKTLKHKNIVLDYNKLAIYKGDEEIVLAKKEFLLLYKLIATPGRIYSREDLLNEIWGYDSLSIDRTVDVHINKIREKLNTDAFEIIAVRGLGYKVILK